MTPLTDLIKELTKEARMKLDKFCLDYLPSLSYDFLYDIFSPIYPYEKISDKNDVVNLILKYGCIAYNHLYIALTYTLPWIIEDSLDYNIRCSNYGEGLKLSDSHMYIYAWVRPSDSKIAYLGDTLHLSTENCLYYGYKDCNLYSMSPTSNNFAYLAIYDIDALEHCLKPSLFLSSNKYFEMLCLGGNIRTIIQGIVIQRSPYMYDFCYNEYIFVNYQRCFYSINTDFFEDFLEFMASDMDNCVYGYGPYVKSSMTLM